MQQIRDFQSFLDKEEKFAKKSKTDAISDNVVESEKYWKGRHDGIRIASRYLLRIIHKNFIARLEKKDLYATWQSTCQDGEQRSFDEWLIDHGNPQPS